MPNKEVDEELKKIYNLTFDIYDLFKQNDKEPIKRLLDQIIKSVNIIKDINKRGGFTGDNEPLFKSKLR